ncbi:MAG: malto-oligosyltrehalose trehalohydrolase [Candidatus Limnocylindrales bacterium]
MTDDPRAPGRPVPLRVWAPRASSVDLVTETDDGPSAPRALQADAGGWWSGAWDDLGAGTDYRFSLDGGPLLPDPRSPWQPGGVHGPSRIVDHGAFPWTDTDWQPTPMGRAVIYELHVGTFSPEGTFDGVMKRLDHLIDLGITHVELMPVNAFPGRHGWGYDGVALFAVHDPYGGPEGLKRLVDACHGRGLSVLLDVVYNHFGPDGNYTGAYGPYQTDRYRTPWGAAINLDGPGSDEVRRFVLDNALGWLRDYHFDGLRIDAVHAFVDTSARHLLEELADEASGLSSALGRDLVLIAESDLNDPRLVRSPADGGYGIGATWSDDLHHAIHVALTGERLGYYEDFVGLPDIERAMRDIYVYGGRYSAHRDRRHGRSPEGLEPGQFVGFSQNHDQVGNRAAGERLAHLAGNDAARVGAALVLAGPFVPLLFQGEEWAAATPFQYMTDHQDPELARLVSEGRRSEFATFGWAPDEVPDPQDPATLERSRLDWSEPTREPHAGMLDWYRRLIDLRRSIPGLSDGLRPTVRTDAELGWLSLDGGAVAVLANLGPDAATIPFPGDRGDANWQVAAGSAIGIAVEPGGVRMPSMSAAVVVAGPVASGGSV